MQKEVKKPFVETFYMFGGEFILNIVCYMRYCQLTLSCCCVALLQLAVIATATKIVSNKQPPNVAFFTIKCVQHTVVSFI